MTIDLVVIGTSSAPRWTAGTILHAGSSAREIHETLAAWSHTNHGDGLLLWDPRLGAPPQELAARLLAGRGDVWHAGLALGTTGQPGLLDFVAPQWMLSCDPSADHESTSWRASFCACLMRGDVIAKLGPPCAEFDTLDGAVLEWSLRAIQRGVLMRHVPALVSRPEHCAGALTISDELRIVMYRHGRSWARYAALRAGITGYAPSGKLMRAWRELPARRPYEEPAPYRNDRVLGTADLAAARVTVLIPTLNRYPYLHVVLDQLRAQTVRPHKEIIIIDQTAAEKRDLTLATKFADLPLKLLYRDEPGQCTSRNAGLLLSSGDFILFIDDDDEVPPNLIEDHLHNLARFDADVSSGVAVEVGTEPLPPDQTFVRASNVFPTNNTLARREVLRRSGLFDRAFDRAPRADGDLGMRVYLSGAFMVLDQRIAVLHHHASEGGLRAHRARVITYRSSRETLTQRHLPHISEIYLMSRYFTERQGREMLWQRALGTLSGRGSTMRRVAKIAIGGVMMPDTVKQTLERKRVATDWLERFPQITELER